MILDSGVTNGSSIERAQSPGEGADWGVLLEYGAGDGIGKHKKEDSGEEFGSRSQNSSELPHGAIGQPITDCLEPN
jgi:hypothetical protein